MSNNGSIGGERNATSSAISSKKVDKNTWKLVKGVAIHYYIHSFQIVTSGREYLTRQKRKQNKKEKTEHQIQKPNGKDYYGKKTEKH